MEEINYKDAKIVAIDDKDFVLESIKEALEFEDMQVKTFQNPKEGLEYLKENKADVLLLDYYMPEMNGGEVVNELRKFNNETIIILQTGFANDIPPLEMMDNLNIQGYVDKNEGSEKIILATKSAIKIAKLLKTITQQKMQIDAKNYQNEFLGRFLNNLMGEIGEKSFAMSGNILALEEFGEELSSDIKDMYNKYLDNIKEASSKLNELIKSIQIDEQNITIKELNIKLNKLFEKKLYIKNAILNIKNETNNEYKLLQCNAKVLIFILVDIIEFFIDNEEKEINILAEEEDNTVCLKVYNNIEKIELIDKINKLAELDVKIDIESEFNQIKIVINNN